MKKSIFILLSLSVFIVSCEKKLDGDMNMLQEDSEQTTHIESESSLQEQHTTHKKVIITYRAKNKSDHILSEGEDEFREVVGDKKLQCHEMNFLN